MTKRVDDFSGYQEHPRFGRGPRTTGLNPSDQPFSPGVHFHWHSGVGVRIPDTAILANTEKQKRATIPVTHYFDSRRICRTCGVYFLFFAEEQRYWYEELQFPLEADMVKCIHCRRLERKLHEINLEYEGLLAEQVRTEEMTLRLVECGIFLVQEGIFTTKVLSKLRGFLKSIDGGSRDRFLELKQRIISAEQQAS